MPHYKTEGIVLKTNNFGEADRLITIFSADYGKIRAIAKGIRRAKSKFGARLEPFSYVKLLLYKGRNLDIVTQTEVIDSFRKIREDFNRFLYGSIVLDLVQRTVLEGEENEKIFLLTKTFLDKLIKPVKSYSLLVSAFEIKLISFLGFRPVLDKCVKCKKEIKKNSVWFSFSSGGIKCENCIGDDFSAVKVDFLPVLKKILKSKFEEMLDFQIEQKTQGEILKLLTDYWSYHLHISLKSRECLSQIDRDRFKIENKGLF